MKRRVLIPLDPDPEPPADERTYYPITTVKGGLARGFTTEGLRTALNSLSNNPNGSYLMDETGQQVMLRLWENYDEHTAEAVNQSITLFTSAQQNDYRREGDASWIENEVCIGVLSVNGINPLGFYIRGGAQAPFHMVQVVVRILSPAFAEEEIKALHPDGEGPAYDHGFLAFIAWRIAMTLTMEDQTGVADFYNVSCAHGFTTFVDHRSIYGAAMRDAPPLCITLHTFGATGDSTNDSLNNAIWRKAGEPIRSDEDPWGIGEAVEEWEPKELPPIYKERRTSLHINLGGDFWVEETRCPMCAQRLIIHAPASMCPSGRPVGLTVKCGDCKSSFGWP